MLEGNQTSRKREPLNITWCVNCNFAFEQLQELERKNVYWNSSLYAIFYVIEIIIVKVLLIFKIVLIWLHHIKEWRHSMIKKKRDLIKGLHYLKAAVGHSQYCCKKLRNTWADLTSVSMWLFFSFQAKYSIWISCLITEICKE